MLTILRDKKGRFISPRSYKSKRKSYVRGGRTSKFKGVSFHNGTGKWISRYYVNGNQNWLGSFSTEYDAHYAYCKATGQKPTLHPRKQTIVADLISRETAYRANSNKDLYRETVAPNYIAQSLETNYIAPAVQHVGCGCGHNQCSNEPVQISVNVDDIDTQKVAEQINSGVNALINKVKNFFEEVTIDYNRISQRAYDIYVRKGYSGSEEQNWFEAEQELRAEASAVKMDL